MKYFLFFIIFLGSGMVSFPQENTGIHFTDRSWSQLLTKANSEDKLIFMDAYTTWCGPCKWMSKNVFPDAEVSALYNRNFINAYIDMEKGEGIELRKKYEVKAYPTYLFINGDGEVVHKVVGQCAIPDFIQHGLDAISPMRHLAYFQKNYAENKKDYVFTAGYLSALKSAYQMDEANAVALGYLSRLNPVSLQERNNWQLINKYIADASSNVFNYVVNHQTEFENLFGKEEVAQKIHSTFLAWPRHYVQYPANGTIVLDKNAFDHFLLQVEKSRYFKKNEIISKSKLTVFAGLKNWQSYTQTVTQMIKDEIIPMNSTGAEELYSYTNMVYRFGKNEPKALTDAIKFAKIISQEISGITIQNKASYVDIYANLLEETGKKKQAVLVRKTIDQKKLAEAQSNRPFQQMRIIPNKNDK